MAIRQRKNTGIRVIIFNCVRHRKIAKLDKEVQMSTLGNMINIVFILLCVCYKLMDFLYQNEL